MGEEAGTDPAGRLDRRQFLTRAAVVGTGLGALPTIISIQPAGAQGVTSPPPQPQPPPPEVGGVSLPRTRTSPPMGAPGTQVAGRTELPRTGVELDDLLYGGLAATAGGAALLLWSASLDE